jgi:hypothetical protein
LASEAPTGTRTAAASAYARLEFGGSAVWRVGNNRNSGERKIPLRTAPFMY